MTDTSTSAPKGWSGSVLYTVLLLGLIVVSMHGTSVMLAAALLVAVAGLAAVLHAAFPGGRFFTLVFANALALYACAVIFVVETAYPDLSDAAAAAGFLLPLVGFIGGALARRGDIHRLIAGLEMDAPRRPVRLKLSLVASLAAIAAAPFLLPEAAMGDDWTDVVYLGLSLALGIVACAASRDIAVFMIDTGILFRDFYDTVAGLAKPAFAFFTFYVFVLILFACLYTIADMVGAAANFAVAGEARDITFLEALYFSIITLSTVGYGDIAPVTPVIRVLVAAQVIAGVILLLFGFQAIVGYARRQAKSG